MVPRRGAAGNRSSRSLWLFHEGFYPSRAHRLPQKCMVTFTLIGVSDRKCSNGLVEGVALAEVPADLGGCTGAGVGTRQCPAADLGILGHDAGREHVDEDPHLHVPELADVDMPTELALRPAEEDVARRLH